MLTDPQTLSTLALHCSRCAIMVEHLGENNLGVAQYALLTLAAHHMDDRHESRLTKHIMSRLEI